MTNGKFLNSAPSQRMVVRALLDRIIRGVHAPDTFLPPERELCLALATSRATLRESLRIVEGMGVVQSRRGAGVRVEPSDQWYLEVLPFYIEAQLREGRDVLPTVEDVLSLRRELILTLLRLVGPKCKPGALDGARTLAGEAWAVRESYAEFVETTLASWRACAVAVDHRPALWTVNSLLRVFAAVGDVMAAHAKAPREYLETHMRTYTLLEAKDTEGAVALMRPYYERYDQKALEVMRGHARSQAR